MLKKTRVNFIDFSRRSIHFCFAIWFFLGKTVLFIAPKAHFREERAGYCARIFVCPGIEVVVRVYYEAPWGNGWGCFAHRILPRFDLCHPRRLLDMFPLRQNAYPTPKWVRSGAVAGDGQLSSRHEVDPGRGSGSSSKASMGLHIVPLSAVRGLRRPHALRGWFCTRRHSFPHWRFGPSRILPLLRDVFFCVPDLYRHNATYA